MTNEQEARKAEGVSRHYKGAAIQVNWEPRLCIHSANCWRSLLDVFRPREAPWVRPDAASADEIAWVVAACPSGALTYERLDGGPPEPAPEVTTVAPQPDGPLYVRGHLRFVDAEGNLVREGTRAALCRCGVSKNKPFCDNGHSIIGFRAD
ncbi:MAG TPA: (4Fe-4S)-binding protein [Dehalococcoidia bacterium]